MVIHWNRIPSLRKCVANHLPPWRWLKAFQRKEFTLAVALKWGEVVILARRKDFSPGPFICPPKNNLPIVKTKVNLGGEQVWRKWAGGSHCLPFIRASQVGCCVCKTGVPAQIRGSEVWQKEWRIDLALLLVLWLSKSRHPCQPQFPYL